MKLPGRLWYYDPEGGNATDSLLAYSTRSHDMEEEVLGVHLDELKAFIREREKRAFEAGQKSARQDSWGGLSYYPETFNDWLKEPDEKEGKAEG